MEVAAARELLAKARACEEALELSLDASLPFEGLEPMDAALAAAAALGLSSPRVGEVGARRAAVASVLERVAAALVEVSADMGHARGLVNEAQGLGLGEARDVVALEKMLDMPEEQLLRLMLGAAQGRGDATRVAAIKQRIKEIFFESFGGVFTLDAFKYLRDRDEYGRSSSSLGGVNDKGLAAGMLAFTKTAIPTSLTTRGFEFPYGRDEDGGGDDDDDDLDNAFGYGGWADDEEHAAAVARRQLAVALFRNVMGYMGDRQLQYPVMLAREVLKEGFEVVELRDELYCQVGKRRASPARG